MRKDEFIVIRVDPDTKKQIRRLVKNKGFKSMTAYLFWLIRKSITSVVVFIFCFSLIGCSTIDGLDNTRKKSPQRLKFETFESSYDKVFDAAKLACAESGLTIQSSSKESGKIYAQRSPGASRFAGLVLSDNDSGEMIGIYVTKIEENRIRVELAIQKVDLTQVGYRDDRETILNLIRSKISRQ